MKILQINSHYNQGGAARIAAYIHRQLLQEGEESYVAFGRGKKEEEKNTYLFNSSLEVYFSALISRVIGVHGWSNYRATKRLIAFIDKIQPDVIHLHALHGYYLHFHLLFQYLNTKKIPCVWTFHDAFAFTGNCGYYFNCEKWKTGCGNCPNIQTYPKSQWLDFTGWMWKQKKKLFTQGGEKIIVTPSKWLTKEAELSFFGKYPCVTIPNGIDTKNIFYPRNKEKCRKKYGYSQQEKIVLGIAVGYQDVRKGAKYIIQMAKDLEQETKVVLVGWNEKNNTMLQDTKNIITIPSISNTDILAEYYSLADVFVLPSLAENYATTSLEAMACGTPVVGFAAGGTIEQLTERKGIAVPVGQQTAFNQAVRQALSEKNGLLQGEELAQKIRYENSMEKMTKEYRILYQKLYQKLY